MLDRIISLFMVGVFFLVSRWFFGLLVWIGWLCFWWICRLVMIFGLNRKMKNNVVMIVLFVWNVM